MLILKNRFAVHPVGRKDGGERRGWCLFFHANLPSFFSSPPFLGLNNSSKNRKHKKREEEDKKERRTDEEVKCNTVSDDSYMLRGGLTS